jgi:IgA Peptidase M64
MASLRRKHWIGSAMLVVAMVGCGTTGSIEECGDLDAGEPDRAAIGLLSDLPVESVINEEDRHKAIDIVFLAEGFTQAQLGEYRRKVAELIREASTDGAGIISRRKSLFNFHRIDNASSTSRLRNALREDTSLRGCLTKDDPHFTQEWMLAVDPRLAMVAAAKNIPETDVVVVLFNDDVGRANTHMGSVFLVATDFPEMDEVTPSVIAMTKAEDGRVLTHELGHALIGLGDEYSESLETYPSEDTQSPIYNAWVGERLVNVPNLTLDPIGTKWKDLVSGTEVGGRRYAAGIYHPSTTCRMLDHNHPRFCPVCSDAIDKVLGLRDGVNDGPPIFGLSLTESPDQVFHSLTIGLTAFDRNSVRSVAAALDGQSLISSFTIDSNGNGVFSPDVTRYSGPNWAFFTRIDQNGVQVPPGDHRLVVSVTDGLGLMSTQEVPLHMVR